MASNNWNPILREPTVRLEWLMVMENINTLHWIESSKSNTEIEDLLHSSVKMKQI